MGGSMFTETRENTGDQQRELTPRVQPHDNRSLNENSGHGGSSQRPAILKAVHTSTRTFPVLLARSRVPMNIQDVCNCWGV
jgi:hypothetical protein